MHNGRLRSRWRVATVGRQHNTEPACFVDEYPPEHSPACLSPWKITAFGDDKRGQQPRTMSNTPGLQLLGMSLSIQSVHL